METKEIVLQIVIWIVGMISSIGFYQLARKQIKTRCEKIPSLAKAFSPNLLESKRSFAIWEVIYAVFLLLAVIFTDNPIQLVLSLLFIFLGMNIAAVDLAIRRIPNELLISLMVGSFICNVTECLIYKERNLKNTLIFIAIGLVASTLIFLIPKKIGLYIGNGDIKLSAMIGFALGIIGYIQAMLLMAIFMLIYLLVLIITKKGGLKTKTPMGPALSFGAIISVIFPILANDLAIW